MAKFTWVRPTRSGVLMTIGIIVLAGLLLGGLFWLKQTGEQARRDEAISTAEQQLQQESEQGVALNEGDTTQTENTNEETSEGQAQSDTSSVASSAADVQELPQTGPAANVIGMVVVGLVTFAIASYYRSRRLLS